MFSSRLKRQDKRKIAIEDEPKVELDLTPVLIIHGASSTKIGICGEKYPRLVFPEQLVDLRTRIRRFPLDGSTPTNEELLKAYWQVSVKKLKINPVHNPILLSLPTAELTECPFRDLVQDYFYDEFLAEKLAVVSDPFLSLVAFVPQIRKLTALIVDIGFSQIRIVPIYQTAILWEHVAQISFGGFELTLQLGTWLQKQGYEGSIDAMFVRDIKENYCYVRNHNQKIADSEDKTISYSIGKDVFKLGSERWKLPELFFFKKFFSEKVESCPRSDFEGNKYDMNEVTLSQAIVYVIKSLNTKLWDEMCGNICLTGGGTKFIGLKKRIEDELKSSMPNQKDSICIHSSQNSDLMPFIGASKLCCLEAFQNYWRSKEDFEIGEYDLFL
ncbi:MAG: hypothetical protein HZR80_09355 [Candidatus Heimdallarchaeota archaeon]